MAVAQAAKYLHTYLNFKIGLEPCVCGCRSKNQKSRKKHARQNEKIRFEVCPSPRISFVWLVAENDAF